MATEFNPGGPVERDNAARASINPPTAPARERSNWGAIGVIGAIAILVVVGMLFSMGNNDTTSSSKEPGATTGLSTTRSPSNPPPAPGPQQGQGESNSRR